MKTIWLMMFLAAAIGTSVAWAVNYNKYAHRDAEFGPLTWDKQITADNVSEIIKGDDQIVLPRAQIIGDTLHDFGVMGPDDEGSHVFKIKNTGEGDLSLEIGATSCKCTLGALGKDVLKPGEETDITLSWTAKTDQNMFAQTAEVRTNDPASLVLKLEVVGQIVRDVSLVPDAWTFGQVASGEPFEIRGKVYTYFDEEVIHTKQRFSSETLTQLSDITVTPFQPGEDDGIHSTAKQGFEVVAKVKPGMRQGAVAVTYSFGFQRKDKNGQIIQEEGDDDPNDYAMVDVAGRIVGSLSMNVTTNLREVGGSYVYNFGRLGPDDSLKAKAFVVLKGSEKDKTKLTIGEIKPAKALRASIGAPIHSDSMVLYPVEMEVIRGDKPLDYRGKNRTDFGSIWIESDNPKVSRMRLAVKFAADAKP